MASEVDIQYRCRVMFVSESGMAIMCNREQMQRKDVCEEHDEILKLQPEDRQKWLRWDLNSK